MLVYQRVFIKFIIMFRSINCHFGWVATCFLTITKDIPKSSKQKPRNIRRSLNFKKLMMISSINPPYPLGIKHGVLGISTIYVDDFQGFPRNLPWNHHQLPICQDFPCDMRYFGATNQDCDSLRRPAADGRGCAHWAALAGQVWRG